MNIEIANRLLQLRRKFNLSQEELAEKIGISRQAVSKWERAEASPDTDNLIALARIYNISLDELLLSGESEVKPAQTEQGSGAAKEPERGADDMCDEAGISGGRLYMRSADGDSVSIGPDGVRISENKTKSSVNIKTGTERGSCGANMRSRARAFYIFPYYMIAVIAFFLWGFGGGGWHVAWVVFLTIPLYYTAVNAVVDRDAGKFAYPVLAVLIFFLWGFLGEGWHIAWLVFLTIPIYYTLVSAFKHRG